MSDYLFQDGTPFFFLLNFVMRPKMIVYQTGKERQANRVWIALIFESKEGIGKQYATKNGRPENANLYFSAEPQSISTASHNQ